MCCYVGGVLVCVCVSVYVVYVSVLYIQSVYYVCHIVTVYCVYDGCW